MYSFFYRISIGLVLIMFFGQVAALTVYDVIRLGGKNYSDQDIIALIEATDSAFELKADDIPRLVELGVSEPVIQAMLKAVPAKPPVESAPNTAPDKFAARLGDEETGVGTASSNITPGNVFWATFKSEFLNEPGSGGHQHQTITLFGIKLFVLRDEGGFRSVMARASAVLSSLREAAALGEGRFQAVHVAGLDAVMFSAASTADTVIIVSVLDHDASAYQQRSGRRVTPDLLAAYWSDLFTDYWSLIFDGKLPVRLAGLHESEAMQELYTGLDMSIQNHADRISSAFQLLPRQEQDHLLRLATTVPREFSTANQHAEESQ